MDAGFRSDIRPDALRDGVGRTVTYLRLSVTDRCNLKCSYCSRQDGHAAVLSRADICRLVSIMARVGIRRVRFTGGEPTLRRDLLSIVQDVGAIPGIEETALTTNGHRLSELAPRLREAGLTKLNVSIDTLDSSLMQTLCGRAACLSSLTEGIARAARLGFASIKTNTVVMGGVNVDEIGAIAAFAWRHGCTPRFIEVMPFGFATPVPVDKIIAELQRQGIQLRPDPVRGWGPARYMRGRMEGEPALEGLVGFISPMSHSFCDSCNRVRVSSSGDLRSCLSQRQGTALGLLLRGKKTDLEITNAILRALRLKPARHDLRSAKLPAMSEVGG